MHSGERLDYAGRHQRYVHPNRALLIDPRGRIIAQNDGEGDQLVYGEVTIDGRVGTGPVRDRKPDIYRGLFEH